jgi:hypothetical protein
MSFLIIFSDFLNLYLSTPWKFFLIIFSYFLYFDLWPS